MRGKSEHKNETRCFYVIFHVKEYLSYEIFIKIKIKNYEYLI